MRKIVKISGFQSEADRITLHTFLGIVKAKNCNLVPVDPAIVQGENIRQGYT